MKRTATVLHKAFTVVLCAAFTTSYCNVADAAPAVAEMVAKPLWLPHVELQPPTHLGHVADYFSATPKPNETGEKPFVVLIQDLHANYSVQKNIVGLLDFLKGKLNAKNSTASSDVVPFALAVEGAQGPIDLTKIALYPDGKVKDLALDYMLREAEMTGAELFAVQQHQPKLLTGVEDQEIYQLNRDVFNNSYEKREELSKGLKDLQALIQKSRARIYSRGLKSFENEVAAYRGGRFSNEQYIQFLVASANERQLDWKKRFPMVEGFMAGYQGRAADSNGKGFDAAKVQSLTGQFLKQASGSLTDSEKQTLQMLGKRSGSVGGVAAYYQFVRDLIYQKQLFGMVSPELASYLEYLKTANSLDIDAVLYEAQKLEDAVRSAIAEKEAVSPRVMRNATVPIQNPAQALKNFVQVERDLDTLVRVVNLQSTETEVRDFAPRLNRFVKLTHGLLNKGEAATSSEADIRRLVSAAIDFYVMAFARNEPMVENTLRIIGLGDAPSIPSSPKLSTKARSKQKLGASKRAIAKSPKKVRASTPKSVVSPDLPTAQLSNRSSVAVLIAGGFHTKELTNEFKKKNVSFIVITPDVASISEHERELYEERVRGISLTPADIFRVAQKSPKILLEGKSHDALAVLNSLRSWEVFAALTFVIGAGLAGLGYAEYLPTFSDLVAYAPEMKPEVVKQLGALATTGASAAAVLVAPNVTGVQKPRVTERITAPAQTTLLNNPALVRLNEAQEAFNLAASNSQGQLRVRADNAQVIAALNQRLALNATADARQIGFQLANEMKGPVSQGAPAASVSLEEANSIAAGYYSWAIMGRESSQFGKVRKPDLLRASSTREAIDAFLLGAAQRLYSVEGKGTFPYQNFSYGSVQRLLVDPVYATSIYQKLNAGRNPTSADVGMEVLGQLFGELQIPGLSFSDMRNGFVLPMRAAINVFASSRMSKEDALKQFYAGEFQNKGSQATLGITHWIGSIVAAIKGIGTKGSNERENWIAEEFAPSFELVFSMFLSPERFVRWHGERNADDTKAMLDGATAMRQAGIEAWKTGMAGFGTLELMDVLSGFTMTLFEDVFPALKAAAGANIEAHRDYNIANRGTSRRLTIGSSTDGQDVQNRRFERTRLDSSRSRDVKEEFNGEAWISVSSPGRRPTDVWLRITRAPNNQLQTDLYYMPEDTKMPSGFNPATHVRGPQFHNYDVTITVGASGTIGIPEVGIPTSAFEFRVSPTGTIIFSPQNKFVDHQILVAAAEVSPDLVPTAAPASPPASVVAPVQSPTASVQTKPAAATSSSASQAPVVPASTPSLSRAEIRQAMLAKLAGLSQRPLPVDLMTYGAFNDFAAAIKRDRVGAEKEIRELWDAIKVAAEGKPIGPSLNSAQLMGRAQAYLEAKWAYEEAKEMPAASASEINTRAWAVLRTYLNLMAISNSTEMRRAIYEDQSFWVGTIFPSGQWSVRDAFPVRLSDMITAVRQGRSVSIDQITPRDFADRALQFVELQARLQVARAALATAEALPKSNTPQRVARAQAIVAAHIELMALNPTEAARNRFYDESFWFGMHEIDWDAKGQIQPLKDGIYEAAKQGTTYRSGMEAPPANFAQSALQFLSLYREGNDPTSVLNRTISALEELEKITPKTSAERVDRAKRIVVARLRLMELRPSDQKRDMFWDESNFWYPLFGTDWTAKDQFQPLKDGLLQAVKAGQSVRYQDIPPKVFAQRALAYLESKGVETKVQKTFFSTYAVARSILRGFEYAIYPYVRFVMGRPVSLDNFTPWTGNAQTRDRFANLAIAPFLEAPILMTAVAIPAVGRWWVERHIQGEIKRALANGVTLTETQIQSIRDEHNRGLHSSAIVTAIGAATGVTAGLAFILSQAAQGQHLSALSTGIILAATTLLMAFAGSAGEHLGWNLSAQVAQKTLDDASLTHDLKASLAKTDVTGEEVFNAVARVWQAVKESGATLTAADLEPLLRVITTYADSKDLDLSSAAINAAEAVDASLRRDPRVSLSADQLGSVVKLAEGALQDGTFERRWGNASYPSNPIISIIETGIFNRPDNIAVFAAAIGQSALDAERIRPLFLAMNRIVQQPGSMIVEKYLEPLTKVTDPAKQIFVINHVLEPGIFKQKSGFSEAFLSKVDHFGPNSGVKYLRAHQAVIAGRPLETIADFPHRDFITQLKAKSGKPRFLVITNLLDGRGDELIRIVPLVQALLDAGVEVDLYSQRPFLYGTPNQAGWIANHPNVRLHDIRKEAPQATERFDGLIQYSDVVKQDRRQISAIDLPATFPPEILDANNYSFYLNGGFPVGLATFREVRINGNVVPLSGVSGDRSASNTFAPHLRLAEELGLRARVGTEPSAQSLLTTTNSSVEKAYEAELDTQNPTHRPILVLNAFGGEAESKGFANSEEGQKQLRERISELVKQGYFVVVLPNHQPWGSASRAREAVDGITDANVRAAVSVAPGDINHAYLYQMARLGVTVEGGGMNTAYVWGVPMVTFQMDGSYPLVEWFPTGSNANQAMVNTQFQLGEAVRRIEQRIATSTPQRGYKNNFPLGAGALLSIGGLFVGIGSILAALAHYLPDMGGMSMAGGPAFAMVIPGMAFLKFGAIAILAGGAILLGVVTVGAAGVQTEKTGAANVLALTNQAEEGANGVNGADLDAPPLASTASANAQSKVARYRRWITSAA